MTCDHCEGEGQILTCIDDLCQGTGECIHGDGYATCPVCKGDGEVEDQEEDDDCPTCGMTGGHDCLSRSEREEVEAFRDS